MVEPIRILILEDVPADAALVERELRRSGLKFVARCVETEPEFLAALDELRPDLVLSDYTLPSFNGMAALRLARERVPTVPFIIVTGSINEETAAECIKAGAADYVLKDHLTRLPAAVRGALERCRLDAEKRRAEEALRESEEKYRRILENMEESYFEVDLAGNLTFFNESLCRLLGYPRDKLMGMNNRQFTDKENAKKLFQAFNKVYRTGESNRDFDGDVIRKDGTKRHVETSVSLRRDISDQPIGFAGLIRDVTERKQAEQALKASEEKYRRILENMDESYFEVDLAGNLTFFNESLCRLLGYPRDELLGMNNRQFTDKEHTGKVFQAFNRIYTTGQSASEVDWEIIRKDGTRRHIETSASLRRDSSGQPIGFSGLFRDITERRRTQAALRESEERFRQLTETMPDAVVVGQDGRNVYANSAAARLLRAAGPEKLIGLEISTIVDPAQYERARQQMQRALAGERPPPFEESFVRLDGSLVPVEIAVSLLTWRGRPALQVVARDITERKRVEEALRQSEARFKGAFASSPNGMALVAPDGRWLEVNPALCQIVGYSEEELLGKTFQDITHPDDLDSDLAYVRQMLTGEILTYQMEKRYLHKQGQVVWILLSVSLVRDSAGQPLYFVSQIEDITNRKRAEEDLRNSKQVIEGILNAIPVSVFWKDKNLVYLGCNAIFARDAGFADPKDLIGKDDYQMGWRDRAELYRGDDREVIKSGCSKLLIEEPLTTPGGNTITILTSKLPLRDSNGEITGLLGTYMDITELKRVEEALRESDERFRSLYQNSTMGLYRTTPDGRILAANPALADMLGYASFDELTSRNIKDDGFQPSYLRAQFLEAIERDGEVRGMEATLTRADGSAISISQSARAIRDSSGNTLYYDGSVENITERKRVEQALRESEERYRLIAENTADVIWTLDLGTRRLTYVSPSVERLRGFSAEEVLAQPFGASLTPDSLRRVDAYLAAALAAFAAGDQSARTGTVEADMPTKNGGTVRTEIVATALTDASGRVTGVLGVTRDITERKRAEEALRESEERFRTLYENSTIGLYRTTPDGRILMANPIFVDMLGYASFDELASRNLKKDADFQPSYPRAQFLEALERDGEVRGVEAAWKQANGNMVFMRESARAIRDSQGNTLYYDGSVENITERKKTEAERERLEENLRQSQKMEAVGQLAGGVAHDFNNLLQAILSLTHVLLTHCTDPERVTADAIELEQHVKHGAALTRQLLLFSRRETARPETLDLNEVIREAGKLLRRLLKGNIAVELHLTERKLPVQADRGQLEQVLFNLAVNAADAMPEGGQLVITTGSNRSTVWLQVADTGVGIPARIRERIFEPFFTTKEEGKGTGLGLAVVHGIVAQHGGSIAVESREGQGTTFTVTLPRGASGEFAALKVKELAGEAPAGRGERVLVVEDEAAARDSLAEILTLLGYEVVAVGSGEEAGLLPAEPVFKVLLTDLMLPGIAGADLARGLLERWPKLQVILMSGYTKDEALRQGISAGPARFLQKPFGMTTLAHELRGALDEAPAASARGDEP
jgi:two-component system, cell cycle sensor histidine kinase and response regulator CckA